MSRTPRWTRYTESLPALSTEGSERRSRSATALNGEENRRLLEQRARILILLFLLIVLALLTRLIQWQVTGHGSAATAETWQAARPQRGNILDRNGALLATDAFSWEVYADPYAIRKKQDPKLKATLTFSLTQALNRSPAEIETLLASETPLVVLAKNVTEEQRQQVDRIAEPFQYRGLVWTDFKRVRVYPMASLGAQVLGCTDFDLRGLYGVEATYDRWLRADNPWTGGQLPGKPQPIPEGWRLFAPSTAGRDLVLFLDAGLQYMADKRLAEAMARYEAEAGTIVIMEVRTGGLLALAHQPNFDPNRYYDSTDGDVWMKSAVSQIYEPGSVFKLITYAAALDTGLITPETILEDKGQLVVGGRTFRNAERKTYGQITAADALAKSVNVISAQLAVNMGPETFYRYVRAFRFGKPTEVDLPAESYGILKEPGHSLWSQSDLAANSFGQALSATALQVTAAVAAIANGGQFVQPQAVKAVIYNDQVYNLPPRVLGAVIKPETAQQLVELMVYTVDRSAHPNMVPGYRIGGKTGTAEVVTTEAGYSQQETIASFVGFLPARDPQIVILVKLVKPKYSPWAEHTAMPTFGVIARDAVRLLDLPADDRKP